MKFSTEKHGKFSFEELVSEVEDFVEKDDAYNYEITIGTDSSKGEPAPDSEATTGEISFVTVLTMRRVGKGSTMGGGGRFFWRNKRVSNDFHTLRNRMYEEANKSIDLAAKFREEVSDEVLDQTNFEVHVDVSETGKTSEMVNEITGMVRGYGFNVEHKPRAYSATYIADSKVT